MKIIIIQILFVIIIFCNCKGESETKDLVNQNLDSTTAQNQLNSAKKTITDCIPNYMDTVSNNFSVRYVDSVEFYTILLRIRDVESALNYRFDCRTIKSTVPSFNDYYGEWISLSRGCGDHCVIYYVFKKENDRIKEFINFDQAYDIDLKNSYCVVVDKEKDYPAILVIDYLNNKCASKALLKSKSIYDILDLTIRPKAINILYKDSSKQAISFVKHEFIEGIPKFTKAASPPRIEK